MQTFLRQKNRLNSCGGGNYMIYPSFRYDFSDFFEQTLTLWNGSTTSMIVFISWITLFAVGITCYILQAVALYSMAKRQGIKPAGFAWVPILNLYLLGKIADVIGRAEGRNTHRRVSLLVIYIILSAFSFGLLTYLPMVLDFLFQFMFYYNYYQPYVGSGSDTFAPVIAPALLTVFSAIVIVVLAIIYFVFLMRAVYIIFKDRTPRNCGLLIVLCIFINYAIGPCLFALRNKPSMAGARLSFLQRQQEEAARYQREQMAKAAAERAEQQNEPPVKWDGIHNDGNSAE